MNVGILTYHSVYNFGANLQALSTASFLKNKGHMPIFINYMPLKLQKSFDVRVHKSQAAEHRSVINNDFKQTKWCTSTTDVVREIEKERIDAVIIGSDAVVQNVSFCARFKIGYSRKVLVRPKFLKKKDETSFPNPIWGEFIQFLREKVPVAMMSVSSQGTIYSLFTSKELKNMKKMLCGIDYISVRDNWTLQMMDHIFNGDKKLKVSITPDPVFGFNYNVKNIQTKSEIIDKYKLADKYYLLSFNKTITVSEDWILEFGKIAQKDDIICVELAMPEGIKTGKVLKHCIDLPIPPLDWYALIKYSQGYIGEKMHPLIVALHNSVPIYSFDHYGIPKGIFKKNQVGSKIEHLLAMASLLDNRVSIVGKYKKDEVAPEVVYNKIKHLDRRLLSNFSDKKQEEYLSMMNEILIVLDNN